MITKINFSGVCFHVNLSNPMLDIQLYVMMTVTVTVSRLGLTCGVIWINVSCRLGLPCRVVWD